MAKRMQRAFLFGWACVVVIGCATQPGEGERSPATPPVVPAESGNDPAATRDEAEEDVAAANPSVSEPVDSPATAEPTSVPSRTEPPAEPVEQTPEQPTPPPSVSEQLPAPEPTPAPTDPVHAEPSAPSVVDIGGPVAVAATKPGLTRIGVAKCKICHRVQFASWEESAHARRTPPLDCEDCHGPGSEYKSKTVMEDPEQALAAGLVRPDRSFCTQCHTAPWTEDLFERVHAHKVEGS